MYMLTLLIPFLVYMFLAAFFVWCGYKSYRWAFSVGLEGKPGLPRRLFGLLAAVVFTLLLIFLFIPPSYFVTRIACANSEREFTESFRSDAHGLTDLSGQISVESAIELLAKRQIAFFEQSTANSGSVLAFLPRKEREDIRRKPFVRLQIEKRGAVGCIPPAQEKWKAYQLLSQGMKPAECLAFSPATSPTGRYLFTETRVNRLGADIYKYQLTDKSGVFPSDTVLSASSSAGANSLGAAFLSSLIPHAGATCWAKPQSVVAAFSHVPFPTILPMTSLARAPLQQPGESLSIRLVPTALNEKDIKALIRKLEAVPPSRDGLRVAVKGTNAIVVKDNKVVAHFDYSEWKRNAFSTTVYASRDHVFILVLDSVGTQLAAITPDITDTRTYTLTIGEGKDALALLQPAKAVVDKNRLLVLGYPKLSEKPFAELRVFEADLGFLDSESQD